VKVAVLEPAGMVTLEGTVAMKPLLLDRVTLAPPAGALPLMVTVPVEVFPRRMEVGLVSTTSTMAWLRSASPSANCRCKTP